MMLLYVFGFELTTKVNVLIIITMSDCRSTIQQLNYRKEDLTEGEGQIAMIVH